jgi:hypothetical protein
MTEAEPAAEAPNGELEARKQVDRHRVRALEPADVAEDDLRARRLHEVPDPLALRGEVGPRERADDGEHDRGRRRRDHLTSRLFGPGEVIGTTTDEFRPVPSSEGG